MPKQRAPFDHKRYEALDAQGLSQRKIAKAMGLPDATLRDNLKVWEQTQERGGPDVHHSIPTSGSEGVHQVHVGIPTYEREGIPEGSRGIPSPEGEGRPEGSQGPPMTQTAQQQDEMRAYAPTPCAVLSDTGLHGVLDTTLSTPTALEMLAHWPDFQEMLVWWQARRTAVHDAAGSGQQLERATYHVDKRFIAAIKRDAALERTTIAEIVNRAFRQYFAGRSSVVPLDSIKGQPV